MAAWPSSKDENLNLPSPPLEKEEWGDLKTFFHIFIKTISTCSLLEDNGID